MSFLNNNKALEYFVAPAPLLPALACQSGIRERFLSFPATDLKCSDCNELGWEGRRENA